MTTIFAVLPLIAAAAIAGPGGSDAPADVVTGASTSVASRPAQKWATDPPLRTGIRAIREALAARLPAMRAGTLQIGEYQVLGATIDGRVRGILLECTLPPAADAQLHPILAALLVAANTVQGTEATVSAAAFRDAVTAINRYGQIFDDPGWRPLEPD